MEQPPESGISDSQPSAKAIMPPPPPRPPPMPLHPSHTTTAAAVNVESAIANEESACSSQSGEEDHPFSVRADDSSSDTLAVAKVAEGAESVMGSQIYSVPAWSHAPGQPYLLEVLKEGSVIQVLDVAKKGAYMFGRSDRCDFTLEHPSSSRYHAVLQYNNKGEAFVFDLGSTHGTFVNKRQVKSKIYAPIHVGDILRFGLSSRLYVLHGPAELMPEEGFSKVERMGLRELEAVQEKKEREASLLRAKKMAMDSDGITWGIQEDAIEENTENDVEEVTWQNYTGELTDKQQKTLEKIHKRNEKLANLKKENDAIQVKEIPQGGLTQGQQTQMARNEQRIEQLLVELESLEETLNESIQESIGAQSGTHPSLKRKGHEEEKDDSSEDEFYDRTGKKKKLSEKGAMEAPKMETVDSLLLKEQELTQEMERVLDAMKAEETKEIQTQYSSVQETNDSLDAYMTSVSSEIVKSSAARLGKDRQRIQTEIDRVTRLLKVADPTGEASKKWKAESSHLRLASSSKKSSTLKSASTLHKQNKEIKISDAVSNIPVHAKSDAKDASERIEHQNRNLGPVERTTWGGNYASECSMWLGAPHTPSEKAERNIPSEEGSGIKNDQFLEYKDRRNPEATNAPENEKSKANFIKEAGRFSQQLEVPDEKSEVIAGNLVDEKCGELSAADGENEESTKSTPKKRNKIKKKKRVLGPQRPAFLKHKDGEGLEYDSWLPPEGQTGDGRTALNEKYGY